MSHVGVFCSALSPAGPKNPFSIHTKLLAPLPISGRSSEERSPLMPPGSAPCCADKHIPYRNIVSSLYKRMASSQNLQQAASWCASWSDQPVALCNQQQLEGTEKLLPFKPCSRTHQYVVTIHKPSSCSPHNPFLDAF